MGLLTVKEVTFFWTDIWITWPFRCDHCIYESPIHIDYSVNIYILLEGDCKTLDEDYSKEQKFVLKNKKVTLTDDTY